MDHQATLTADDAVSAMEDFRRMLRLCRAEPLDAAAVRQLASALAVKWADAESAAAPPASSVGHGGDDSSQPLRWDVLRERCQGDVAFCRELLQIFARRAEEQLRAIEEAVATGNAVLLTRKAHTTKSVAATLAAYPICRCAAELEQLGRRKDLAAAPAILPRLRHEVRRCLQYIPQLLAAAATERPAAEALEPGP